MIIRAVLLACALSAPPVLAQETPPRLQERLEATPENAFEHGMLLTLRAVEKALQKQHETQIGRNLDFFPVLRLYPDAISGGAVTAEPGTLTEIVRMLDQDLAKAQQTLAAGAGAPFEMDLRDLWFDINSNGMREAHEGAVEILGAVLLADPAAIQDVPLVVRFDAADRDWLIAYTHMIAGITSFYLAFDPTPVLTDLQDRRALLADAPETGTELDFAAMEDRLAKIGAALEPDITELENLQAEQQDLNAELAELRGKWQEDSDPDTETRIDRLERKYDALNERIWELRGQMRGLEREQSELEERIATRGLAEPIAPLITVQARDVAYVILESLKQQPDAARIKQVQAHWLKMIEHNRLFWKALSEETDNMREWIPNAAQDSALPVNVPDGLAKGWGRVLDDIEATLTGELLIQHGLFPAGYGIDLNAYFNDPEPLDIIGWIHGAKLYPYAKRGPVVSLNSMRSFNELTGGNGMMFTFWLN